MLISAELEGQSDEAELRSLTDWLRREPFRPWRIVPVPVEGPPGTMGALSDTLQVALGAGGAVGALAAALTAWIQTRPKRVRLRVRGADGSEVVLDAELKDPDAVMAMMHRIVGDDDG